ncbi:RE2 [Symbiodinium natans]|uniref:RE2 protein n=1 Tax=Symbiodinium natans TaxID=878477 RepID=A0A812LZH6_9DINO|nr:RE2 [Symbiodinium natans]
MAETKSGSYIYNGDPSTFYDWKFRTELRLKLYEDAIRSKASQARSTRGDSEAGLEGEVDPDHNVREPEAADTADEEHEGPQEEGGLHPGGADEYFDKLSQLSAGSRRSKKSGKSAKPISFEYLEGLPSSTKARTEMVHRVLEGLRDEAFELARDIGVDALTAPGGLRSFIERMREVVFPRATEEARELFRAGQRPGTLSRQAGESMLSYISRRRRWWNLLKTLDASIELSEPMRVELLLELSGLSRQEALVVKACTADPKKFEQIANTLVQHYTGVHLREGRALGGFTRKAFPAIDEEEEFEEYELDEDEAIALNAMEQFLEDSPEVGHAIQLSLAANAAFGKAKGKGKNRSKGKGKGKGKVVRSHLTLEQRRDKLKALKAKSRCMRCGGIGHWAGDPECKFPAGKAAGKAAHVAVTVLSSEEGLVIPSEAPDKDHSGFVVRAAASKSAASRSAAVASAAPMPIPMEMEGGDRKFYLGQYKGKTYNEIARLPAVVQWAQVQVNPSRQLQDFLAWFNRYYVIEGDEVVTRASIGIPEGTYVPRVKNKGGKKVPPNPPLEPCVQGCKDFTHAGSTMNWLRSTCRDCGKVTREPREVSYTNDPETCPHEIIDRRGSSRSVSRTFCKQCGTFIDEVPADFQRRRRDAANRMLNATVDSLSVMSNTQIAGESRDLEHDDVELIMGVFNDSVTTMIEMGMRVTPSVLHSRLSEAIVDALEPTGDSPDSWSRVGHVGIIDPTDLTKEERVLSRWERLVKGVNWQDHCVAWEDAFLMGHDRLGIAILEAQWADPAPAPSTGINLSLTLDDLEQARPESPQVPDPVGPEQGWTRLGQLPEIDPDEAIDDSLAFPDYDPYDPYLECTPNSNHELEVDTRAHAHAASTDIVHLDNLPMVDLWSRTLAGVLDSHEVDTVDYHEYLESGMLWDQVRPKTFTTPPPIVILSCGIKYYMNKEDGWWGKKARDPIHWADRVPQVFRDGYTLIVQDLRDLSDPANGAWNDHIGRHPEIIKGLVNAEAGQRLLRKNLVDLLDHYKRGEKVALVAFCTSNRHRSVAFGTTLAACLLAKGIEDHLLVHLNAITSWKGMVCGGGCSDCGEFSKPGLVNLGKHANSLLDALEGFDEANRHQCLGKWVFAGANARLDYTPVVGTATTETTATASSSKASTTSKAPAVSATSIVPKAPPAEMENDVGYWRERCIRQEAANEHLQVRLVALETELREAKSSGESWLSRAIAAEKELEVVKRYERRPRSRSESYDSKDESRSRSRDDRSKDDRRGRERSGSMRPGRSGPRSTSAGPSIKEEPDEEEREARELETPASTPGHTPRDGEACVEPGAGGGSTQTPVEPLPVVDGMEGPLDHNRPWAANLSFPDLTKVASILRRTKPARYNSNGWIGPATKEQGMQCTLKHNIRFWVAHKDHSFVHRWDNALDDFTKSVFLFRGAERTFSIIQRDVDMRAALTIDAAELGDGDSFIILARSQKQRAADHTGGLPRVSTYRGEARPYGQSLRRPSASAEGRSVSSDSSASSGSSGSGVSIPTGAKYFTPACNLAVLSKESGIRVIDVGLDAMKPWEAEGIRRTLQEVSPSLVVVAIEYQEPGLNHSEVVDEVIAHCECSGSDYLIADVADTERWGYFSVPMYPDIGHGDVSYVSNNSEIADAFEGWTGEGYPTMGPRSFWDLFSSDFLGWLINYANDHAAISLVATSYPVWDDGEIDDSEFPTFDSVENEDDVARMDPGEEAIQEDLELDEVQVDPQYLDGLRLLRCNECEENAPRRPGQASSAKCLEAIQRRWITWAGHPKALKCDRGLHNRGVLARYMAAHGVDVTHAPLETPEAIGRVERHGGIIKGMARKVISQTQPRGWLEMQQVLDETCLTKNSLLRQGGYSPAQWVLGRAPRELPSILSEDGHADLGAIQDSLDPESAFALQHMVRAEAKKAFVQLDTSKRVQRALLRNARAIPGDYQESVWLLCENIPVLASAQNLRPATDAEALAFDILHGNAIIPEEIVKDQQGFDDYREPAPTGDHDPAPDVTLEEGPSDGPMPSILEEDEEHPSRRLSIAEPEQERTPGGSRRPSYDVQDDLPEQLRQHFQRVRDAEATPPRIVSDQNTALSATQARPRAKFIAFMANRAANISKEEAKSLPGSLNYYDCSPAVQRKIDESRKKEWMKYESFQAAIPVTGKILKDLLDEGHVPLPSKWVDTVKNIHEQHLESFDPEFKSRMVACGNFEGECGVRTDSPTSDIETHAMVCAFAASEGVPVQGSDIKNAYFQALPIDRIVLMRQPRGGLPGVDPEAMLLVRVPVYGLQDSGRGFWKRVDKDAKDVGLNASRIFPAFYYHTTGSKVDLLLTTHVDDFLWASTPTGDEIMNRLLERFEIGRKEIKRLRFCGKQFDQSGKDIVIDVSDNTRRTTYIDIAKGRQSSGPITQGEERQLRSVVGSLSWIARQGRPDILYKVSYLQSKVKGATVAILKEANKCLEIALAGKDFCIRYKNGPFDFMDLGVLTASDASFAGAPGLRSQQGRIHFLVPRKQLTTPGNCVFDVALISFGSTTIKRVCRATLQAETYALQSAQESGDRIRALLAELYGQGSPGADWYDRSRRTVPHMMLTDCRSLSEHLNVEVPSRVQDKRLQIELNALRQALFEDDGTRSTEVFPGAGDQVVWTSTATMIADCLTKSMRPDFLIKVLTACQYQIERQSEKQLG